MIHAFEIHPEMFAERGLSLDADALASLKKAVQRVDAQVTKLGGDAQAQEPVPAAAGRGSKAAAGGKAAAAEGGAGSGAGAGREGPCVELGGGKKATISNFRGGTMVRGDLEVLGVHMSFPAKQQRRLGLNTYVQGPIPTSLCLGGPALNQVVCSWPLHTRCPPACHVHCLPSAWLA